MQSTRSARPTASKPVVLRISLDSVIEELLPPLNAAASYESSRRGIDLIVELPEATEATTSAPAAADTAPADAGGGAAACASELASAPQAVSAETAAAAPLESKAAAAAAVASSSAAKRAVLVALPGAQQNPDNELMRRCIRAYASNKVALKAVHATTYERADAVVQKYLDAGDVVILHGHSMGASTAAKVCRARAAAGVPLSLILLGCGAVTPPRPGILACAILGEHDGDGKQAVRRHGRAAVVREHASDVPFTVVKANGDTSLLLVPHNADHSLRSLEGHSVQAKDARSNSAQTRNIADVAARFVKKFVDSVLRGAPTIDF